MSNKPRLMKLADMERETLVDGFFSRTAIRSDGAIVTFNWFEPGFPRQMQHDHPFDQLTFVVSGKLHFYMGADEIIVGAGECVFIPPNLPHTAVPVGDVTAHTMDVFAPARSDYLFLAVNQADWGQVPTDEKGTPFHGREAGSQGEKS